MTRTPLIPPAVATLALSLIFLLTAPAGAQTALKTRLNERNRERPAPEAAPVAEESVTELAQNAAKSAPEGSISRLPAAVMRDERVSGTVDAVRSRVEKEMEGRSTEDVLRAAQQRIAASKSGSTTTITDVNRATGTATARPVAATAPPPAAAPATATPTAPAPAPTAAPVAPVGNTPTTPAPAPAATAANQPPTLATPANIPPPVPLRPKYDREKKTGEQAMEIESDESVMDNKQRLVTFIGNVVVNHPEFKLIGDNLQIYLHEETTLDGGQASTPATADGEEKPPFKRAIATGGMVEIEKIGADGKSQIAKSRKADYDALTGDIVLSGGPPTLQSGAGFVNPSNPDAVIILRGSGQYEVKGQSEGGGRSTVTFPVKSKGGAAKGGGLPGGTLDSITNRNDNKR